MTDLGGGGFDVSGYVSTDRWFHGHLHISEYSRKVAGHERQLAARASSSAASTPRSSRPPRRADEGVLFVGPAAAAQGRPRSDRRGGPGRSAAHRRAGARRRLRRHAAGARGGEVRHVPPRRRRRAARSRNTGARPVSCCRASTPRRTAGPRRCPSCSGRRCSRAMACGRPAICTDVASMPEVVVHGETGYVVPPGNPAALGSAIAALRGNPESAAAGRTAGARDRAVPWTGGAVLERFSRCECQGAVRCQLPAAGCIVGALTCALAIWHVWHVGMSLAPRHSRVPAGAGRRQRALAGARGGGGRRAGSTCTSGRRPVRRCRAHAWRRRARDARCVRRRRLCETDGRLLDAFPAPRTIVAAMGAARVRPSRHEPALSRRGSRGGRRRAIGST